MKVGSAPGAQQGRGEPGLCRASLGPNFIFLLFMFSKSYITHYKIIFSEYIVGDIGEKLDGMYAFMNRFGK